MCWSVQREQPEQQQRTVAPETQTSLSRHGPLLSCLVLSFLCCCSATLHKDLANSRSDVCGRQHRACRVPLQPQREKVYTAVSLRCSLTVAVQLEEGEGEKGELLQRRAAHSHSSKEEGEDGGREQGADSSKMGFTKGGGGY